jgi:transcriptional regulator
MAKHTQRALFPGAVEMMVLQILKPEGLHGYALAQEIQRSSNNLIRIQGGTLYQALQRLRKARLVKAEWGVSSTNRRVRIYKLTAAGKKHVAHEVSRFERMLEGITHLLASRKT